MQTKPQPYSATQPPALVIIALALLFFVAGCRFFSKNNNTNNPPIARVQNTYLYYSQLKGLVNPGVNPQDSAAAVSNYIDNWVRRQTLLHSANKEMANNMPDFEQQLQDYRESLLLHAFEQQLLLQNPDTIIDSTEIETYYQQNKNNFVLNSNVVKAAYVIMSNKAPKQDSVKLLLKKNTPDARQILSELCSRENLTCILPAQWYEWKTLQQQIPLDDSDFNKCLQNNFFQTRDAVNTYCIGVETAAKQGNTAPLDYCKPEIEKLLTHKRSLQYLQNTRKNLYENALEKGDIEFYQSNPQ